MSAPFETTAASSPVPIWVISLARATERRARISSAFAALGLDIELCDAVDGLTLPPDAARYSRWRALYGVGRRLSLGEIGCARSHLDLYQRMVDDDVDVACIVEDDAEPSPELATVLADLDRLPPDWQVVNLHSTFASAGSEPFGDVVLGGSSRLCTYRRKPYGTVCYLLRRSGAQRLLAVGDPVHLPADELLFRGRPAGLTTYGIEPSPVAHIGVPEGPEGFDSHVLPRALETLDPSTLAERVVATTGRIRRRVGNRIAPVSGTWSRRSASRRSHGDGASESRRRVLIVEMSADKPYGHFPVAFAELADELIAMGCDVEALTRRGWLFDGDPASPSFSIRRFGPRTEIAYRWGARFRFVPPAALGTRLEEIARTFVIMCAANRLRRRFSFSDVIVYTNTDPLVGTLLTRRGRWLSYQYFGPPSVCGDRSDDRSGDRPRRRFVAAADRTILRASQFASRHGNDRLRIAASVDVNHEAWRATAPWLAPERIPFIAARPRPPVPDARERLQLPTDARLALLFGDHPAKDSLTVWRAFASMSGWQLMIGGSNAAAKYRDWASRQPNVDVPPILFEGFVDEDTRALLYAAADLVVISFKTDTPMDSGNLVDAIACGRTVVCSDGCPSAEVVRRRRLGTIFEPGSMESLVDAVRGAPRSPDPDGLREARAEFGARQIARRNLDVLDSIG